mgnify:FL=1
MFLLYSTKRFVPAKYLFSRHVLPDCLPHHPDRPDHPDFLHPLRGRLPRGEGGGDHRHYQQLHGSHGRVPHLRNLRTVGRNRRRCLSGPLPAVPGQPEDQRVLRGSDGKKTGKVDASTVTVEDGVVRASGYTTLSPRQINAAYEDITSMSVPFSDKTTVKIQGVRSAFEGIKQMVYASPPKPSPTPRPGTSARSRRWGCSSTSSMPRARARPSPGSRTWAWPTTSVSSAKATWPPVPQGPHLDGHLRPRLGRAHIRSRFLPGPDSQ